MARKSRKTKVSVQSDEEKKEQVVVETEKPVKKQKVTKVVRTPSESKQLTEITPATKASAEIIREAIKETEKKNVVIPKPLMFDPVPEAKKAKEAPVFEDPAPKAVKDEKVEAPTDMYSLMLGRYCRVVTENSLGQSKKRPVTSFIALMDHVIRESSNATFAKMLKFFVLEANGIMSNHNALNGIETITDPYVKTRVMTLFTVFNGLAVLRTTGRRPTFSVNAIRSIVKSDKFTNWVNATMNA